MKNGPGLSAGIPDGKAFFVIDLSTGDILWSYTKVTMPPWITGSGLAVVDVDNDGFIDSLRGIWGNMAV
jgi:hypothetical protein